MSKVYKKKKKNAVSTAYVCAGLKHNNRPLQFTVIVYSPNCLFTLQLSSLHHGVTRDTKATILKNQLPLVPKIKEPLITPQQPQSSFIGNL